jgi:hypothetical protein
MNRCEEPSPRPSPIGWERVSEGRVRVGSWAESAEPSVQPTRLNLCYLCFLLLNRAAVSLFLPIGAVLNRG